MTTPAASESGTAPIPDLTRLGGLDWARRTGGRLTGRERGRLLGVIARAQGTELVRRVLRRAGKPPRGAERLADLPEPPDSAFARTAEQACDEQPPYLVGHGYRAWIYGVGLAALDRADMDPELFYVACLLHDHGLTASVEGEDFTVRSAARASRCGRETGVEPPRITAVADALTVHITPGITSARDGALGTYVQAGALLDLTGSRIAELPRPYRGRALLAHPPNALAPNIIDAIRNEATLNPRSRLALLHSCGFTHLIGKSAPRNAGSTHSH